MGDTEPHRQDGQPSPCKINILSPAISPALFDLQDRGTSPMTLRDRFVAKSVAAVILAASSLAFAQKNTTPVAKTGYAPVNGLQLYYEIQGTGEPLMLLHGGVVGIAMFGPNLQALSETRKVIAVELQGQGRTADIDRPLSFEAMADDVGALIKYLGTEKTDVLGYSLGGGVALQTAIRHPDLVRKLVVVSAPLKHDGFYPEILAAMSQMGPSGAEGMKQSPLNQLYPNVDWARLFTKLGDLLRKDYDWTKEVSFIKAPMMIVFADADAVRTAHIMEFWGVLGGGKKDAGMDGSVRPADQLAILPGLTHYNIVSSPTLVKVVTPFFDAPMPGTK
jgi:pimeloyl-ACP methyl ester carboxylesterase